MSSSEVAVYVYSKCLMKIKFFLSNHELLVLLENTSGSNNPFLKGNCHHFFVFSFMAFIEGY